MNAQEIINELKSGKTVAILSDDVFEFMREIERHNISCEGIDMRFRNGQCFMTTEDLPAHDGFHCEHCEKTFFDLPHATDDGYWLCGPCWTGLQLEAGDNDFNVGIYIDQD